MESSDEALAAAAGGGDRTAFGVLAERHYDRVFRLAFRMSGTLPEAEDLTQDVLMALPGKLAGYRREARFSTWLYRVVMNAAHDRRRRAATRSKAHQGWGAYELTRKAAEADSADRQKWLAEAMAALPPELRDTVALLTEGDLSQAEAAEVLGVSPGTVAWRMSEVKKRLAEIARREGAI
ncbi:MAG: RNA polymerase sigma factor [Pseudomonadota bacterium]